MNEFEGFKNSTGTVIYSPNEFRDFCRDFFLDYGLGKSALIHLRVLLYVLNSDSESVETAVSWALSQLGIAQEGHQRRFAQS